MRVFVAGATGAIGTKLVTQLVERGHAVIGTYRRDGGDARLRALGAQGVQLDLLDAPQVHAAVRAAAPDAVVHQATALSGTGFGRNLDKTFEPTNRLRNEGTDALVAATRAAGVGTLVAQSFASMRYARTGSMVKSETDPLDDAPLSTTAQTNAAMRHVDDAVAGAGGVVLRYGGFYGAADDGMVAPVRKRQFPIVGDGGGYTSFIHLDDAAAATVLAIEDPKPGIYNIVDDEPAAMRDWLPVLAEVLGAKPPRHVPVWLARMIAGDAAVMMGTEARAASNAKAKSVLGWTPRYASWREGFRAAYRN